MHSVLCLLFVSYSAPADLQDALAAMRRGDFQTAYKEFTPLADNGDDKAMMTVGNFLLNGQGTKQNYPQAFQWFCKAMDKGNIDAYSNLAVMFRDGLGTKRDLAIAHALARIALDKATAQNRNRIARVHKKIDTRISVTDFEYSMKLTNTELTSDRLKKLYEQPRENAAKGKVDGFFRGLKGSYNITDVKEKPVRIKKCLTYSADNLGGAIGFQEQEVKDTKTLISGATYFTGDKKFAVNIPPLSTGDIVVYSAKLKSQTASFDYVARFYDSEGSPRKLWDRESSREHATIVTTPLPKQVAARKDLPDFLLKMKQTICADLPDSLLSIKKIDGKLGPCIQTIVINQVPNVYFPQSDITLSHMRKGVKTIGVSRIFVYESHLVEMAMVVSVQKEWRPAEYALKACERLDIFQSSLRLKDKR